MKSLPLTAFLLLSAGCVNHFVPGPMSVSAVPELLPMRVDEPLFVHVEQAVFYGLNQVPSDAQVLELGEILRHTGVFSTVSMAHAPKGGLQLVISFENLSVTHYEQTGSWSFNDTVISASNTLTILTAGLIPTVWREDTKVHARLYRPGEEGEKGEQVLLKREVLGEPKVQYRAGTAALFHSERRNTEVMWTAVVTALLQRIEQQKLEL